MYSYSIRNLLIFNPLTYIEEVCANVDYYCDVFFFKKSYLNDTFVDTWCYVSIQFADQLVTNFRHQQVATSHSVYIQHAQIVPHA